MEPEKHVWLSCNEDFVYKSLTRFRNIGRWLANSFRIYEMQRNVREWCLDEYGEYPTEPQVDPDGANKPDAGKVA